SMLLALTSTLNAQRKLEQGLFRTSRMHLSASVDMARRIRKAINGSSEHKVRRSARESDGRMTRAKAGTYLRPDLILACSIAVSCELRLLFSWRKITQNPGRLGPRVFRFEFPFRVRDPRLRVCR